MSVREDVVRQRTNLDSFISPASSQMCVCILSHDLCSFRVFCIRVVRLPESASWSKGFVRWIVFSTHAGGSVAAAAATFKEMMLETDHETDLWGSGRPAYQLITDAIAQVWQSAY